MNFGEFIDNLFGVTNERKANKKVVGVKHFGYITIMFYEDGSYDVL